MRKINTLAASLLLSAALFSCNSSSTKEEETKKQADSAKTVTDNKMPADSSKNSMQVNAMFVDYTLGDASHFTFKDESGKVWDFGGNDDTTYKFAVELPKGKANSTNQGWGSDKALQGKWFVITYVYKDEPQYEGGPMAKVAVIKQVKPK